MITHLESVDVFPLVPTSVAALCEVLALLSHTIDQIDIPPIVTAAVTKYMWLRSPLRDVLLLISSSVETAPIKDTIGIRC